ncbi:MAG: hypothetical protein M3361_19225 [Candidatus Tectomicrobia bacterium]|nr:hypothetical protein [Candidatus Tectomicrobia bacterium]
MKRVVGFMMEPEHEDRLAQLTKQLGWNRSKVIQELLARAVVETQPSVRAVLPAAAAAEEAHVR